MSKIRFLITFEIVGKPKEHIEKTIRVYLDNIKKDSRIKVIKEDYAEAIELEDGLFSTFCEAEMEVEELELITWLSINFSPAHIEILEPTTFTLKSNDLTNWINDLISKLHEISAKVRTLNEKNKLLSVSLKNAISNFIVTLLEIGPKDKKLLSKLTGISEIQLDLFLKEMIKKGQIEKKKELYYIIHKKN